MLDLIQSAAGGCSDKIGGIVKMWMGKVADISSITQTAIAGTPTPGYNVSAITMAASTGLVEIVPTDNKTAFFNETPGEVGAAKDGQASMEFEGVTAQKVFALNGYGAECEVFFFVKYRSGVIRMVGIDFPTPSTYQTSTTAYRAKIGTQSGTGNNDSEKCTLEVVGQSKYLSMPSTMTEVALNALNF